MSDRCRETIENKIKDTIEIIKIHNRCSGVHSEDYDLIEIFSEILLDIRDRLDKIEQNQGVNKWGTKL